MAVISPALIEDMRRVSELLRQGSLRSAQEQLEAILASNPDFVEALRLLAGTRQALGDPAGPATSGTVLDCTTPTVLSYPL